MNYDGTNYNALGLMGAALGQEPVDLPVEMPGEPPGMPALSYQQVYSQLFSTCISMIGREACHELLGYRPFVCPSVPLTQRWWFWLGAGAVGGALVGKFLA